MIRANNKTWGWPTFAILAVFLSHGAGYAQSGTSNDTFGKAISAIATEYDGIPYLYGGDPDKDGATDNSHLFHSIFKKAAGQSGHEMLDYMTISQLLENAHEVNIRELRNGDLLVIQDRQEKHVALVYDYRDQKTYRIIYASEKRQKVSSFDSADNNFHEYWLENIIGFYRLNEDLFKRTN